MNGIAMTEPSPFDSKEDFESRLRRSRGTERAPAPKITAASSGAGMAQGMRIATELVAAVAVGVGIGLLLDSWLDTKPWMLIVFILLGSIAGMLNVYRIATGQIRVAGFDPAKNDDNGRQRDETKPSDQGK